VSAQVRLRAVEDSDLDVLFGHQADPQAAEMAAFPARDRAQFDAHWAKIRLDGTAVLRTILADDVVAGYICCWPSDGQRLIGYWIGREHWGRGVATRALALFLREVPTRPLYAHVGTHNIGSIRVLEKCGFQRGRVRKAPDGIEEITFVLDGRHVWIDASAGIAGDMLLGALIDAGADLDVVRAAVDTVLPGAVELSVEEVRRAGLRAAKVHVRPLVDDPPHRTWRHIRGLLGEAALTAHTRTAALAVFDRLAGAEAAVHGVAADEVHFHEVGALDSIADVVGVCAALDDLGVKSVSASEVALGSGSVRAAHGRLPVPAPAVAELARGWQVRGDGPGELATPTGMALIRALAERCETLPPMTVEAVGVGAGTRDTPDRPNVVRVVLSAVSSDLPTSAVLLEANVDDLDPRLWPGVLSGLLAAGASDAWLVPILMKKGRPAHTLCVLTEPGLTARLRDQIFRETTTLGVREGPLHKTALARVFHPVPVPGGEVSVKIGHVDGTIVQVMPEFEDVAALARATGTPERAMLQAATAAASAAGLVVGAPLPPKITR
jgi:hypothetical protein